MARLRRRRRTRCSRRWCRAPRRPSAALRDRLARARPGRARPSAGRPAARSSAGSARARPAARDRDDRRPRPDRSARSRPSASPTLVDAVVCADDGVAAKPAPDMVFAPVPPARTSTRPRPRSWATRRPTWRWAARPARASSSASAAGVGTERGPGRGRSRPDDVAELAPERPLTTGRRQLAAGTDGLSPRSHRTVPFRAARHGRRASGSPFPLEVVRRPMVLADDTSVQRHGAVAPPRHDACAARSARARRTDARRRPPPDRRRGQRPARPRRPVRRRHRRGVRPVRRRPRRPVAVRRRRPRPRCGSPPIAACRPRSSTRSRRFPIDAATAGHGGPPRAREVRVLDRAMRRTNCRACARSTERSASGRLLTCRSSSARSSLGPARAVPPRGLRLDRRRARPRPRLRRPHGDRHRQRPARRVAPDPGRTGYARSRTSPAG